MANQSQLRKGKAYRKLLFNDFMTHFDGKGWFTSRELFNELHQKHVSCNSHHSFAKWLANHYTLYNFRRKKYLPGDKRWAYAKTI